MSPFPVSDPSGMSGGGSGWQSGGGWDPRADLEQGNPVDLSKISSEDFVQTDDGTYMDAAGNVLTEQQYWNLCDQEDQAAEQARQRPPTADEIAQWKARRANQADGQKTAGNTTGNSGSVGPRHCPPRASAKGADASTAEEFADSYVPVVIDAGCEAAEAPVPYGTAIGALDVAGHAFQADNIENTCRWRRDHEETGTEAWKFWDNALRKCQQERAAARRAAAASQSRANP